jgi:DNA-binding NtrC family response regulator
VLVVDDEAAIREIIKATLENNGYDVLTANDGTEAVRVFARPNSKIHLVMVDLMMPFMDGSATIRALQQMDPETRFIAISGLMDSARINQLQELGKIEFLAKPFTTEQLLTTIANIFRSSPASAKPKRRS